MTAQEMIKALTHFPMNAQVENVGGRISIITQDTYEGEYIFDIDTDPSMLPNFNDPDTIEDIYLDDFATDGTNDSF